MKRIGRALPLLSAALLLAGCGLLRNARTWAPGWFGMERAGDRLWVEHACPESTRTELRRDRALARVSVERWFGPPRSDPDVIACSSRAVASAFGLGGRAGAHSAPWQRIVLGPHLLNAAVMAHEWSHAELAARLGARIPTRAGHVPRWLDEGLACVVGDEPRFSEDQWAKIERSGRPVPSLRELWTFRQIEAAEAAYGDTSRDRARNLHVVYTTSAHEVRRWLGIVGTGGVRRLVKALDDGESFTAAYARIEREGPGRYAP